MTAEFDGDFELELVVNGEPTVVDVEVAETLAYTLRHRLGLTGTKVSCDVQACGACTVLVDDLPRSSCTYLTYEARDRQVLTVEGIESDDELRAIQAAFIETNGFQCGYCTGGMLLAAISFLRDHPDDDALIEYMSGNICRCTGYLSIVAAILRARVAIDDTRATSGRP
jgi:aerobic-type carbon monoxide dehydrogenase small subunit (CoxS/CutS family)